MLVLVLVLPALGPHWEEAVPPKRCSPLARHSIQEGTDCAMGQGIEWQVLLP